jgi:hypothetical protein
MWWGLRAFVGRPGEAERFRAAAERVRVRPDAVSRKVWRFGCIRRLKWKLGGRRMGTGRELSGSLRRFWMIGTCCASSFLISWRKVAVSPVSFLGPAALAFDVIARLRAGSARAEAPAARFRKERRERAGSGAFSRVSFAGTSFIASVSHGAPWGRTPA